MNTLATRQDDMVSGLLAEYALGALSGPAKVLVESHLELSEHSANWLDDLRAAGALLSKAKCGSKASSWTADQLDPIAFADTDAALLAVMDAIDGTETDTQTVKAAPKALEDFLGMRVADVPWKRVMPGLSEYRVPQADGAEVSLLRIEGGRAMPVHTHHGSELTLVLQGGFSDGAGHYGVGDICYADDEVNHRPIADAGEVCICFAVVDAPVELTGPIGRLMNSFIR